jgi:hypothetical protein
MQFLGDLDGLTVILSGLSVILASVILGLLWGSYGGRWPKTGSRVLGLLLGVALLNCFPAYDAFCPDADQPHIRRTGALNPFKPYRYRVGKHSYNVGILECIGPCGKGVPLMEFNASITALVGTRDSSAPLTVTYLGRKDWADIWNGYRFTAHPVVEIDDFPTGERMFYVDTTRHWPRVIVLLADCLICILTSAFCLMRIDSGSDDEGGLNARSDRTSSATDELTGLGLDSEDRGKS